MRTQPSICFLVICTIELTCSFTIPASPLLERAGCGQRILHRPENTLPYVYNSCSTITLNSQSTDNDTDIKSGEGEIKRKLSAAPINNESIDINSSSSKPKEVEKSVAQTNTVNERLMAELQAATEAEKGPKTAIGKKFRDNFRYSDKTDEEREAALEAARDLNGVNPVVTILASFFAFGMAFAFWSATQFLGELFMSHPVSPDAPYAFSRMASVFRNVVMGLSSLASGFSAVSGLGVFLLGVRVAYGEFQFFFF